MQSKSQFKTVLLKSFVILSGIALIFSYAPSFSVKHLIPVSLFTVALIISRLFDIQLPQGGKINIDTAVVIAMIISFSLPDIIVATVVGIAIATLIKNLRNALKFFAYPLSVRLITIFLSAHVYYALGGIAGVVKPLDGFFSLMMLSICFSLLDLIFDRLTIDVRKSSKLSSAIISTLRFIGPAYLSLASLGILLAVMYKNMGYWSLPFFFLPLSVTRLSFKSYFDIRNVYRKTIEALANAIEVQNPKRSGHGRRVANYAIGIAKELGIYGRELELIGYAALLHDIGMLGVDEDSLDQLLEQVSARNGNAPHAIIGAEIIEQVDFFCEAADMVRKHHMPYDKIRRSDGVPIGARIINVASYFDMLTRGDNPGERLTPVEALNRIKKEQGIIFDPKVVRALRRMLRKQGKLLELAG